MSSSIEPSEQHLKVLKTSFKLSSFKKEQWQVIRAIMYENRDCCLNAATAFGKSLCYQFPAVFLNKIAVVFTNYLTVAEDQIHELERNKINACVFKPDRNMNFKNCKVLFIHKSDGCLEVLEQIKDQVCLVTMDEYKTGRYGNDCSSKLMDLKRIFPETPILCLSAMNSVNDQNKILAEVYVKNPLMVETDMNRPNLEYSVLRKNRGIVDDLRPFIDEISKGAVIIYVPKGTAAGHADRFAAEGIDAIPYDKELKEYKRQRTLTSFLSGEINILLVNEDFRVNRSDVRLVIHFGMVESVRQYYIESGQAGRDHQPAKCVFYLGSRGYCMSGRKHVGEYLYKKKCRRIELLRRDKYVFKPCSISESCCDYCQAQLHSKIPLFKMYKDIDRQNRLDITTDARILLNLVATFERTGEKLKMLEFLMGTFPQKSDGLKPLQFFGKGKKKSKNWWSQIFEILRRRKLISLPNVQHNDAQQLIDVMNSEDFFCPTKRGLEFMRLKTWKMYEDPLRLIIYLEKTNREYYIERKITKFRLRKKASLKKIKSKKDEKTLEAPKTCELFNFETTQSFPTQGSASNSKKSVDLPGCSKSSEEMADDQSEEICDEDDENVKNLVWSRKALQKPVNVDLDTLMDFMENLPKNQSEDGERGASQQSKNEEGEESSSKKESSSEKRRRKRD